MLLMTSETLVLQGRQLESADIVRIRKLITDNPKWSRRRLSKALCDEWGWCNGKGQMKDMAARSLLLKLDARALIKLPVRRQVASNRMLSRGISPQCWDTTPVMGKLRDLGPLTVQEVSQESSARLRLAAALSEFHYLGYRGTVGENLQYTVTDAKGRLLACLLFGSAAWKCKPRDEYIGWDAEQRARNLYLVTNNTRYLIMPWIRVPHLSSWILGQVLRRLSSDWQRKYGHSIYLVETFVERDRFAGTSYKASNWIRPGTTTGRSRQDRSHSLRVPVKDVYLYRLNARFRRELSA
jgi:hypothetical protein